MAVLMPGEVCSWERGDKASGQDALPMVFIQTDTTERAGQTEGSDRKYFLALSGTQTLRSGTAQVVFEP